MEKPRNPNVENNSYLQVRIPKTLRQEFLTICKREGYSGSGLIRKWMREFVESNTLTQDSPSIKTDSTPPSM